MTGQSERVTAQSEPVAAQSEPVAGPSRAVAGPPGHGNCAAPCPATLAATVDPPSDPHSKFPVRLRTGDGREKTERTSFLTIVLYPSTQPMVVKVPPPCWGRSETLNPGGLFIWLFSLSLVVRALLQDRWQFPASDPLHGCYLFTGYNQ